jgi:hypothetical protein
MKIKIFILAVLFGAFYCNAQTAYYDAFRLKNYIDTNGKFFVEVSGSVIAAEQKRKELECCAIINSYCDPKFTTPKNLHDKLGMPRDGASPNRRYNPFLEPYLSPGGVASTGADVLKGLSSGLSSAGNLDVTNFADGIAKFLVERAKEEVNVAFFQKLKRYFQNEAPEMKILFGNTTVLLDNFEAWDYANILVTLREAFNKDLKNLLTSVPDLDSISAPAGANKKVIARVTEINKFFASDEGKIFSSSLILSDAMINSKKFPSVLNEVDSNYFSKMYPGKPNFKNATALLNIFSLSLSNSEYDKNYISARQLDSLFSDSLARTFYLGLVFQQINDKKIVFRGDSIANTIRAAASNYTGLKTYLKNLLKEAADLDKAYKAIEDAKKNGESISKPMAGVLYSANSFLNAAANIESINSAIHFPDTVKTILKYASQGLGIAHDLLVSNYNSSIVGVIKLMADISKNNMAVLPKTFMNDFVKYGSFASNIVAAKSSEEVKKAIDAVALPVGSYSIKRNNAFNIAVNGYLGFGYDFENPDGVNRATSDARDKYNLNWNVSAPVGVSFSFPLRGRKRSWGSMSTFISVIDVGSLAQFRLVKDTVKLDRKILLKDIFCPGISLIYGIPRCPVSLAFGYYYRPELAFDKSTSGLATVPAMGRLNFSVLIDIPVVNIHNKQKWGKKQ